MKDSRGVNSGTKFYFQPEHGGSQQIFKMKSVRVANDLIAALKGYSYPFFNTLIPVSLLLATYEKHRGYTLPLATKSEL